MIFTADHLAKKISPKVPSRVRFSRLYAFAAVVFVLMSLVFSACSQGTATPTSITVWHYFSDPNQVKVMTDYAALFQSAHPGITVENVYVPYDQLDSKLIAAAAAKTGPDVVVFNGADTSNLASAGVLAPLDTQWSAFADSSQFPASVVHKLDGKIYSVQGYVNLLGLWYNADLLGSLKIAPPTTPAELEAALGKVKAAGKMGMTLSGLPNSQGEWQGYPWLTNAGFDYANPSESSLVAAFTTVQNWVNKGYLSKEAATWDQTVPFQQFLTGNVAFAENGNWQIGTAKAASFKYGVVPLPVGASAKVYLGGEGEGIGAFSKAPTLAWQYLQETYFSKAGQLIPVNDVGSIPSRPDTAADPAVTGNPLLKAFSDTIAAHGGNYPADIIPPKNVAAVQLAVGQAWSAVLSGQTPPKTAASQLIASLEPLLK